MKDDISTATENVAKALEGVESAIVSLAEACERGLNNLADAVVRLDPRN